MKSHGIAQKCLAAAAAAVLLFQMMAPMQVFAEAPVEPEETITAGGPEDAPLEAEGEAPEGTPTDLPEELLPAYDLATAAEAVTEKGNNAFDMAGLDVKGGDELDPTGEREKMRPYGEAHVIPSNDIFIFGAPDGKATATPPYGIYGVKDPANPASLADLSLVEQSKKNAATTQKGNLAGAFGDRAAVAAVAFNPTSAEDNHMRPSATAMLAATNANTSHVISGPIVFAVTDRLDTNAPQTHVIASFPYKNGDEKTTDGWSLDNKSIQQELYIEALDLDGDGVDEIAFLLPGATGGGHARLVIYKQKNPAGDVTSANNWVQILCQDVTGVRMGQSKPSNVRRYRTHSLAVGDLNCDGLDDIAVVGTATISNFAKADRSKDYTLSQLEVFYTTKAEAKTGGYTSIHKTYKYDSSSTAAENNTLFGNNALLPLPTAASTGLAKNKTDFSQFSFNVDEGSVKAYPIQLGVTIGDSDGDGKNELLLGYNMMGFFAFDGDMYWGNMYSYAVERLVPGKGETLQREAASNGNAIVQVNIKDVAGAAGAIKGDEKAKLGDLFGGKNEPASTTENYYNNGGAVRLTVAQMIGPGAPASIIVGNNRHDPASAATFSQYTLNIPKALKDIIEETRKQLEEVHFSNISLVLCAMAYATTFPGQLASGTEYYTLRPGAISTGDGMAYGYLSHMLVVGDGGGHDYVYFNTNDVSISDQAFAFGTEGFHRYSPCAAALPCIDSDFVQLEFQDHQYSYTDPTVVAALASQPYYQDLANYYEGYRSDSGGTSYSTHFGTGHGTSSSSTTSMGGYVSTSIKGGTKYAAGIVDAEVNYNHSWASESESTVTRTQTRSFEVTGEDSVVLLTYPVDRYVYKMSSYDENYENLITNDYTITVPYPPVNTIVSLEEYNKLYAAYPDTLPDIDSEVFTHTQGYPGTYPATAPQGAFVSDGVNGTNSSTNQTTTSILSIEESSSKSSTTSNSVDFSVGAGVEAGYEGNLAVAKVTVTLGFNYGSEWSQGTINTQTSGTEYSGAVSGNPNTSLNNRYGFNWQMMQYNHSSQKGRFNFPVVTYLVTKDISRISLPERFEVDHNRTTNNAITLRWSPSAQDKTPGSGEVQYMIARLSGTQNEPYNEPYEGLLDSTTYDAGTGLYSVTIPGLLPATRYDFQLTCKLKTSSVWTVPTPAVMTTTNPDDGEYKFEMQPANTTLVTGVAGELKAAFSHSENVAYRWQKKTEDGWAPLVDTSNNVTGMTGTTLNFSVPKAAHAGQYRLGVTLSFSGGEKTFYSDVAEVTVTKQQASLTLSGVDLIVPQTTNEITPTVTITPAAGMQLAAGSRVVFVLTHADGDMEMLAEPVSSPAGGTVTASGIRLPKNGEYTLGAYYVGDSIHDQSHAATPLHFARLASMGGSYMMPDASLWSSTLEFGNPLYCPVEIITSKEGGGYNRESVAQPGSIEVERLSNGQKLTNCVSIDGGYSIVNFDAAGDYKVTISHGGAQMSRKVTVTPCTVRVTAAATSLRKSEDTLSMDSVGVNLDYPSATMAAKGPAVEAFKKHLALYDAEGKAVTLDANTRPGTYRLRLRDGVDLQKIYPNFNFVFATMGNCTVLAGEMQIHYGAENARHGTVTATTEDKALASGGTARYGKAVTFTATPAKDYRLSCWLITTESGTEEIAATGNTYTLTANEDCDVRARFVVDAPVKGVKITHPSGALTVKKGSYSEIFTAKVEGGLTGQVTWSFAGVSTATDLSLAHLQTLPDNTSRFKVPASLTTLNKIMLRATSEDDAAVYDEVEITLTGGQIAAKVLSVALSPRQDTIRTGERFSFQAQVLTEGDADAKVNFEITGAKEGSFQEGDLIPGSGITTGRLTAGDQPGTVITIKAVSAFDDKQFDTMTLVVVPAEETPADNGQAEDIHLLMSHVVLEAGSEESLWIGLMSRSGNVVPGTPSVYKILTNRQELAGADAPTASLGTAKNGIYVGAGSAKAGDTFVVRVPVAGNPASWAECRVDIAPAAVAPEKMEPRTVSGTVTAYAYSTNDILIGLARTNTPGLDAWTLRNPKLKVVLAEDTHSDLKAAFNEELEVVDDGRLCLVPSGPGSMERLRSSYKKVALALVDRDTGKSIKNVLQGSFTLKINKSTPKITAEKIVMNTWGSSASAKPVFKGGVVTKLEGDLPKTAGWLTRSANGAYFVATQGESGKANLTMFATVEGWSKPVKVKVNITASGKAPELKLKSASVKMYQDPALSTGIGMTLQTKKRADTLSSLMVSSIAVAPAQEKTFTVVPAADFKTSGNFTLKALDSVATKTKVTLQVLFSGANAKKTHDISVTVNPVRGTPKLKLAKTSIALNAAYGESVSLPIGSTVADYDLKQLNLTVATTSNDANVPLPQVVGLAAGNPALKLMAGSDPTAGKTSKFVLNLWAKPYDLTAGEGESGPKLLHKVTVSVKVTDKPATVKLAAKGKLDVSLAQPSPVRVTARLDSHQGAYDTGLDNVKLAIYQKVKGKYDLVYDGTNATPTDINFKVTRSGANSMEWLITPAPGGAIEPGSYRVGVVEGTVAGEKVLTQTKGSNPAGNYTAFTVAASKPKATATPVSGVLYRNDGGSEQLFKVALPAGSGAIGAVKLSGAGADSMYFDYKDLGGGYVVIHFREPFTTKRGKAVNPATAAKATTTLTLQVFIEGGSSVTPATSVKVKVAAR